MWFRVSILWVLLCVHRSLGYWKVPSDIFSFFFHLILSDIDCYQPMVRTKMCSVHSLYILCTPHQVNLSLIWTHIVYCIRTHAKSVVYNLCTFCVLRRFISHWYEPILYEVHIVCSVVGDHRSLIPPLIGIHACSLYYALLLCHHGSPPLVSYCYGTTLATLAWSHLLHWLQWVHLLHWLH